MQQVVFVIRQFGVVSLGCSIIVVYNCYNQPLDLEFYFYVGILFALKRF